MFNCYNCIDEMARLCTRGFKRVNKQLDLHGDILREQTANRLRLDRKMDTAVIELKSLRDRISDVERAVYRQVTEDGQRVRDVELQGQGSEPAAARLDEDERAQQSLRYDPPAVGFPYGKRVLNISVDRLYRKLNGLVYTHQSDAQRERHDHQLDKLDGMRAGIVIPRPAGTFGRQRVYVLSDDSKVRAARPDQLKVIG